MSLFKIHSEYQPSGDQPKAIASLTEGIQSGIKHQTLLGVTGSGKTFTMAHVIANCDRPALILAHNKTLAAQLYSEFKVLFPENAVEYFVSYYDYYQPEAYVPRTDTFIEKDSSINENIDKLRHSATRALLERRDVIIVASVSCIYGLGAPEAYNGMLIDLQKGMSVERNEILAKLTEIQYQRNDIDFVRGNFRVRGDVVDIFPTYEDQNAVRLEFFGDEIEQMYMIDALTGQKQAPLDRIAVYPGSHYVTPKEKLKLATEQIRSELQSRIKHFERTNKPLEAHRIKQRTEYDLELIEEMGFCKGIENYSRHLTQKNEGEPPPTLLEYFPKDYLLFVDESHITVSQVGGMYRGDRARKSTLVEFGFRLPSALDNRPLKFEEFQQMTDQIVYVSATPADYELEKSEGLVIEQIVRPTGLVDPQISVRSAKNQIDDLLAEVNKVVAKKGRVLVTTLTKKMAENLTKYMDELGVRVRYLHSDIDTLERSELIRDLRLGRFDVLVGINLLREGLDIPEVQLVAILDADKEGFLRSVRSLIQTFGRAARNVDGYVICYADKMTDSLKKSMEETNRRREIQLAYNQQHGITPKTIQKAVRDPLFTESKQTIQKKTKLEEVPESLEQIQKQIKTLTKEMKAFAQNLEFEKAAPLRDQILELKKMELRYL